MEVKVNRVLRQFWTIAVIVPGVGVHYEKYKDQETALKRAKLLAGTNGKVTYDGGKI
jgi:hypothetical protein